MKAITLLAALFICTQFFGQENNKTDFFSEIKGHDISKLLILEDFLIEDNTFEIIRPEPLGFIGKDFQRFNIRFISIIKNPSNPIEYFVYGKTKTKNKIRSFQGKITLTKSEIYTTNEHSTRTSEYRFLANNQQAIKQGELVGTYEFFEDPNESKSGILKGQFVSNFYLSKTNKLGYDVIKWNADRYENNQFTGKWIDYKTGRTEICNWGDFRIPNSGDLDTGTEEFIPNAKYNVSGWSNYQISLGNVTDTLATEKAQYIENEKWWLNE